MLEYTLCYYEYVTWLEMYLKNIYIINKQAPQIVSARPKWLDFIPTKELQTVKLGILSSRDVKNLGACFQECIEKIIQTEWHIHLRFRFFFFFNYDIVHQADLFIYTIWRLLDDMEDLSIYCIFY